MTPNKLRALADSLESNFMTQEDRKAWVTELRSHAKNIEHGVLTCCGRSRNDEDQTE